MKNAKKIVAEKKMVMNDCTDLFELLKKLVCCTYISDLRTAPYNAKAQLLLQGMDLDMFSTRQVNDVCKYIGAAL